MRAPASRTWSGVRPLTVAWVPTGMKTGVSTAPCGVSSRPSRAAPSRACTWKRVAMQKRISPQGHKEHKGRHKEDRKPHFACLLCALVVNVFVLIAPQRQSVLRQLLAHLVERRHAEV